MGVILQSAAVISSRHLHYSQVLSLFFLTWGQIEQSCHLSLYLTLPAVHSLFIKLLADVEVDLRGAHRGGGLDVELLSVLPDLHMWFGGGCPSHFPEHGVYA